MDCKKIGVVKNDYEELNDNKKDNGDINSVLINSKYSEGLSKIEEYGLLEITYLIPSSNEDVIEESSKEEMKGFFASNKKNRPNKIETITVKLIERKEEKLNVKGLDVPNETIVLDIKPFSGLSDFYNKSTGEFLKKDPRGMIRYLRENDELEEILLKAGELHGHFCPFLSLGVKAGTYGLERLKEESSGMEEVVAIVETNSCFSDGVQYSTGCTFGNNALYYRDYGKTAVTIAKRNGKSFRLRIKNEGNLIEENYPEANNLFEKVIKKRSGDKKDRKKLNDWWKKIAFDFIRKPIDEVFCVEEVDSDIPDYAPIFEDEFCDECGEKVMYPKIVEEDNKKLCIPCADSSYLELNGRGLVSKD